MSDLFPCDESRPGPGQRVDQRSVRRQRRGADTPSLRKVLTCRAQNRRPGRALRAHHSVHAGPPGLPPAGNGEDVTTLMAFYREGRRDGDFKTGVQVALSRILTPPTSCSGWSGPAARGSRQGLSHQRSGAGLAPVVLPVEQHSRQDPARPRRPGPAAQARGAGRASQADDRRSALRRPGGQFRRPVAAAAQYPRRRTRTSICFPPSTRNCGPRWNRRPTCSSTTRYAATAAWWIC